jgi:hypothetical protein
MGKSKDKSKGKSDNDWIFVSKQIDKQTNNKRLVLKKGQIAILEGLYGCRFGGCWCCGLG